MAVEQIKAKRAGLGVRVWNRAKACPGLTLFTPIGGQTAFLIDLSGSVVHTWTLPYPPGLYAYLTERRTLVYNAKILETSDRFIAHQPWKGGAMLELDWSGRALWEVRHPDHHHDGRLLRNGNVMMLTMQEVDPALAARVQGGRYVDPNDHRVFGDCLTEMTTSGDVVWEWRLWEHLDPAVDRIIAIQDDRREWTHANAVVELPDGDLLVSCRMISQVWRVNRQTGAVTWKLGAPPLAQQHAPEPLPNGNVLIFDNGTHRLDHHVPFSRVLEVDPATNEIVWSYQEREAMQFFSPLISNATRLANGNTLINEGNFGRFFEVTPDGEIVWEYVNPYFGPRAGQPPGSPLTNAVFRVYRYADDGGC